MSGTVLGPVTGHIRATPKPKKDRRARNLAGEIPPRNLAGRARSLARPARSRRAEVQGTPRFLAVSLSHCFGVNFVVLCAQVRIRRLDLASEVALRSVWVECARIALLVLNYYSLTPLPP